MIYLRYQNNIKLNYFIVGSEVLVKPVYDKEKIVDARQKP